MIMNPKKMKNMLTEEQIKNLKKGDKLIAEVQFHSPDCDGNLICLAPFTTSRGLVIESVGYYTSACLSLPPVKSKPNPCRKFRKGDKVRIVKWNGRIPLCLDDCIGSEYTVSLDEGINGFVHIEGEIEIVHVAHLELITPVEERDLYYIVDSPHAFSICKHGGSIFAATFYKDQPRAREHAKKYCADLNAEHRKEQK